MNEHNFSQQSLYSISFEDRDLSGADFSFSRLENINFKNTNLKNSNFSNSHIKGCDFHQAILTKANFADSAIGVSNVKLAKILLLSVFISVILLLFPSASSKTAFSSSKWGIGFEWIGIYMVSSLILIMLVIFTIYSTLSLETFNEGYFLYVCLFFVVVYLLLVSIRQAFLLAQEVSRTCFSKSDLTQANFKNTAIKGVNFSDAILVDAEWSSDSKESPIQDVA
jgi:uncharacterized protein YjbI with pentapeptide repeats